PRNHPTARPRADDDPARDRRAAAVPPGRGDGALPRRAAPVRRGRVDSGGTEWSRRPRPLEVNDLERRREDRTAVDANSAAGADVQVSTLPDTCSRGLMALDGYSPSPPARVSTRHRLRPTRGPTCGCQLADTQLPCCLGGPP